MREVIKILKQLGRECIAELIGTLILCGFGNASIAVFILAPQNLSSSLSVHFSWGLGKQLFSHLLVRYGHGSSDSLRPQKEPPESSSVGILSQNVFQEHALAVTFQSQYQEDI